MAKRLKAQIEAENYDLRKRVKHLEAQTAQAIELLEIVDDLRIDENRVDIVHLAINILSVRG